MTFIDGVNRLLRSSGILRGDDDNLTTFADTQHNASMNLAIIAIQSELADLLADRLIAYEKTSASITTTSGTRTYALASDFVRFYGQQPFLYDATNKRQIFEYQGGVDALRKTIYDYKTLTGTPISWYWEAATTKQIGLYPVPNAAIQWDYDYEKDITVSASSDTLPFVSDTEARAFVDVSLTRFKMMLTRNPLSGLSQDPDRKEARSRLLNLMRPTNPNAYYGNRYR